MISSEKPSIGIIGAGRLGTVLARQLLKANYPVLIANSKEPQTLTLILQVLLPGAKAVMVEELVKQSDIIILAIPLNKYKSLSPELFSDKIVIDAMNYWPATEGYMEEFSSDKLSSAEHIQKYFSKAKVVKTLNHVAYNELEEHSLPEGDSHRRAVALAGDNTAVKLEVAKIISDIGFDPIDLGILAQGKKIQPGTSLFNARYSAAEMKNIINH